MRNGTRRRNVGTRVYIVSLVFSYLHLVLKLYILLSTLSYHPLPLSTTSSPSSPFHYLFAPNSLPLPRRSSARQVLPTSTHELQNRDLTARILHQKLHAPPFEDKKEIYYCKIFTAPPSWGMKLLAEARR